MYKKQGENLKHLRKSFGYTLSQVSKELEVTINYLSLIERGLRKPSDAIMYKMAQFYNLNPIEIFSLYGTIPTEQIEKIISCHSLVNILSNLTNDELTEEEKDKISDLLQKAILKLLEGKR